MRITTATPEDLPAVERLLEQNTLPRDGVAENLSSFLVAEDENGIVGAVGLELFGSAALLRSAVVAEARRNGGLGAQLIRAAIDRASELGVNDLYLLTMTAENYFPRFGFERVDRGDAPDAIRKSVEFTTACPASATLMRLQLKPDERG